MLIKYLVRHFEDYRMNYVRDKEDNIRLFNTTESAYRYIQYDLQSKGFIEAIDMEEQYVLKNAMNEKDEFCLCFNMYELLQEINRDHSEEWTDYDQKDFQEGLEEWTSYELIGRVDKI